MDATEKLALLRNLLKKEKLDGYVQPVHDEYDCEYPPACHRRVEWMTGFSGSAGLLAVLAQKAALFVDGRYTLQAKNEVDGALFEQHNSGDLFPEKWLADTLTQGARLGYDPKLHTRDALKRMRVELDKKNIALVPVANLVDAIWRDRPASPSSPLMIHEMKYAGEESASKRKRVAELIVKAGADACVLAAPDAVCWLLNVRAHDVENTPLLLAQAIIDSKGQVKLYVSPMRCDAAVQEHLGKDVALREPSQMEADLKALGKQKQRVLCDAAELPVWFTQLLSDNGAVIVDGQDPCLLPKAMKNPVELQGMRNAHIRDGAAVVKLLCWLDDETQKHSVTEMDVSEKLLSLRAMNDMFTEPSFTTIAGSGPNGAIVHYRVSPQSNRTLQKGELFLLDSGGQYPDGTTDITRTVPIGTPTVEHKDCFTRVLKGQIAIALAQFPEGTRGSQLDVLARQYLWQAGLDYDHGTGHGVGHFLNVHEGPQRISKRGGDAPLKPGMIVSNEPGYYKTGAFGIRLENLVAVVERAKGQLAFETITCAPLDARVVDASMLSTMEKDWLNQYHAWVLKELSPLLEAPQQSWLTARCAPV